MRKLGIIVSIIALLVLLTACSSSKQNFLDCIYSNKCSSSLVKAASSPDDEVILYLNDVIQTEMGFDLIKEQTSIDYTEYESGDTRIVVQYYTEEKHNSNFHINQFNVLFSKLSDYLSGKGVNYDTFKVELNTSGSFTRKSITLYDGEKVYSSLNADFNAYDKFTEEDTTRLQEDISFYRDFDRFSYDFIYETISILFNHNQSDEDSIRLLIVHRDSEEDFYIPRDQIHSVYQDILSDITTVVLEEDN